MITTTICIIVALSFIIGATFGAIIALLCLRAGWKLGRQGIGAQEEAEPQKREFSLFSKRPTKKQQQETEQQRYERKLLENIENYGTGNPQQELK